MSIKREFLGWTRPGVETAAEWLARQPSPPGELNLGEFVVALSGGRAGRRLLELLVLHAEQHSLVLTPPRIVTVSQLPELLYEARRPFANDLTQRLAWAAALKSLLNQPDVLRQLAPTPPAPDDDDAWLALAEMLARLHRELAADGLDFLKVVEKGKEISGFRESARWLSLAAIQEKYHNILDSLNLWDKQSARLFAIEKKECRADKHIVLVGTVDLNKSLRAMLDTVAEKVTALVIAPPEDENWFDKYGCLTIDNCGAAVSAAQCRRDARTTIHAAKQVPSPPAPLPQAGEGSNARAALPQAGEGSMRIPPKWIERQIELDERRIEFVDDPADQVEAVVRTVAEFAGEFSSEQISVGLPDESLAPLIVERLAERGVPSRWGVGSPPTRTGAGRLLAAAAEFLDGGGFADFAALVRCVDVERWLAAQGVGGDWLARLDEYYNEHLPPSIGDELLGDDDNSRAVSQATEAIRRWLKDFDGKPRPLDQWRRPIAEMLIEIYGRTPPDQATIAGRATSAACEAIAEALRSHAAIPAELMPTLSGADAVRLVLEQIAGEFIAPPPDRKAVELLGWLELPLDDAPALAVASLNDGFVPSSPRGDPFLPNQLRQKLEIEDHDRRWARDAYALSALAASRRGLKLIVGRRDAEGNPLAPSRLLFASDEETIARRVKRFCADEADSAGGARPMARALRPGVERSRLEVPRPRPLQQPIDSMRVTEFRDYIACPYRYYLRHVLKLESPDCAAVELDPAAFGTLAHDVLGEFGKSPLAAATDAERIALWLDEVLDEQVRKHYGAAPLPAVRVQVEQLRLRLGEFAGRQAAWAAAGWRIEYVEVSPPEGRAAIVVDGLPMRLRGRIDRIDLHEPSGKRLIIDYKTSDAATTPEKAHRRGGEWLDLQLPLYRHLAEGMGLGGPLNTAYFILPKELSATGICIAEWTEEDLQAADAAAAEVVRGVRAERFWPPNPQPPDFSEEFAPICQDGQFRAAGSLDADDEEQQA